MNPIHIKAKKGDIAERVIIAGDPARVEQVSKEFLEDVRLVNTNRGLIAYTGKYKNVDISVVVHGIGVPSASLVLEELAMLGAKAVVRLGSCGAMIKGMRIGDIVIPTAASYYPGGAYYQYMHGELACAPSSPDFHVLRSLVDVAEEMGVKYYLGPILTSDAFYAEDPEFAKRWASRGIIAVEMECSALFMLGYMRGVKVGALLMVSDSLVEDLGFATAEELKEYVKTSAKVVLEALRRLKL